MPLFPAQRYPPHELSNVKEMCFRYEYDKFSDCTFGLCPQLLKWGFAIPLVLETRCVRISAVIPNVSVQTASVVKTIVQVYWTASVVMIILEIKPYLVRIRAELLVTGFLYSYYSQ